MTIFLKNLLLLITVAAELAAIIFFCLYIPSLLPAAIAAGALWLVNAAAMTAIVLRRNGEAGLSAALLVAVLPLAGAALYFAFSYRGRGCGAYRAEGAAEQTGIYACARDMCGTGAAGCRKAVYLKSGEQYLSLLFEEIEKARSRVYLEYYIIARGEVFERLTAALKCAKVRGAEIKIVFDGLGCAFKLGGREIRRLKEAGAEVKVFHRLTPLPRPRLNLRDHRKIAVADGAAFTGGVNLADEYANISSPYGMWKDTGVALYGGAADMFAGMFMSVWNGSFSSPAPEINGEICLPFYDSPPAAAGFYESACVWAIDGASERVHIFTPYFCPPERLLSALELAARRGVDVKVIIPHIPDKRYAFETSLSFALPLMGSGVRFYEFTPGFMHAKSVICDDRLLIGSYNFDYRSARTNYECGVMLGGGLAEEAELDFEECLRLSSTVRQAKCSLPKKLMRAALRVFYPLM